MAHNLALNKNGKYSCFTKGAAWHGLSQVVEDCQTAEEAIKLALLDFEVVKTPVYAHIEGVESLIDNKFATVRMDDNRALGIVGGRYTIVQNREAFKFFDAIVGEGKAIYETAGALGKGERIFITAKLPDQMVVTPEDVMDQYVVLTNTHDGSGALQAFFSPIRVVCENTMNMAFSSMSHAVSIRHSASIHSQLHQAHKLMGIIAKESGLITDVCTAMTKVNITDVQLRKFVELAMKPPVEQINKEEFSKRFSNTVDAIMGYAATDATQLMVSTKGTLYGAMNAITGYYSNVKGWKNEEDRMDSIIFGTAGRNNAKAFDLAAGIVTGKLELV